MTATISRVTVHPSGANRGPTLDDQRVTDAFILIRSDLNAGSDTVTLADVTSTINDDTMIETVLPNTWLLKCWLLITEHITLDLRNANLDILSTGTWGAGIQGKAHGATLDAVLAGEARATLLTGTTLIIIDNAGGRRSSYGPFQRNATWRNRGGDTRIVAGGERYDWASQWHPGIYANQAAGHLGLYDFEAPYRVALVGLNFSANAFAHMFLHADSTPRDIQLVKALPGGGADTIRPYRLESSGGEFPGLFVGDALVGVSASRLAGHVAGETALTAHLTDIRASAAQVTINRRQAFWDILGIAASQTDPRAALTGVILETDDPQSGQLRIAYRWQPTLRDPSGTALADTAGRFEVTLGTVEGNGSLSHTTGQRLTVALDEGGQIAWTDPFARSRPQPGRDDRVRPHIRLPRFWTNQSSETDPDTVFGCTAATWQFFKAGYQPAEATDISWPFAGDYGNLDVDLVISLDPAFGSDAAAVTAERARVTQLRQAAAVPGRSGGEARAIYQILQLECELNTATYPTVAAAWSAWNQFSPIYAPRSLHLSGTLAFRQTHLADAVALAINGTALEVRAAPVAGDTYGATTQIDFNGAIPDCTIDTPNVSGVVDDDHSIDGLTLAQDTILRLNCPDDCDIRIDGLRGEGRLTVRNIGAGNLQLFSNTAARITAGQNVTFAYRIRVSGGLAGTADDPGRLGIYPLTAGEPDLAAGIEVERKTTHTASGLDARSYRVVACLPGYEPIARDVDALAPGVTDVELIPVRTGNAVSTAEIPAGVTVGVEDTPEHQTLTISTVRVNEQGVSVEAITGSQTNALLERAKSTLGFLRGVARKNRTDWIRHQSLTQSSLRDGQYRIAGAAAGRCRHRIQAVGAHDGNGDLAAGGALTVLEAAVEITTDGETTTINLPQVIILPAAAAATYTDVSTLLDGAIADIALDVDQAVRAVQVDGLTADGETAMIGAVIAGAP